MSGNANGINLGFEILRMGGRASLLGTPKGEVSINLAKSIIFKGATVHGIHGRLMYKTWFQMTELLRAGRLELHPAITDKIAMKDFSTGMERMKTGAASKVLVYPNGIR
jgi:threonine 3-dehydrogenase